jgi:RHH-type rel operon transcriptional repressor/antitoxin RelB
MLAIRLPTTLERRLTTLARKTGRTKTFYAREAIMEHLGDLEDLYLVKERLADIDEGRTKLVPLEEAMKERNLL